MSCEGAARSTFTASFKNKVAVLSTGDELVEPGKPLAPASVYDSNGAIIAAAHAALAWS